MAEAYIFAASEPLATADIPSQSVAYDPISDAGKDNTTFRGIYFELDEPQELMLGFQADLASGAAEQEFRASKVKLVRYGTTDGIQQMENGKWRIEPSTTSVAENSLPLREGLGVGFSPKAYTSRMARLS